MKENKYYPRLRELRNAAGMKQTDLAAILNMQQNQSSRYERGDRELPMHIFIALARYYNVSLDYMAGLTDDRGEA